MTESFDEDKELRLFRNVGLDLQATMHMVEASAGKKEWTCHCAACQYVRNSPRVMEALIKAVKKP